jgi:hypothetical protein
MRLKILASFATALALAGVARAGVIYDDLTTPLGNYLGGFAYVEIADDVTLAPGARVFESATVGYAGFNFDGDETLTLNLYAMDGAPTPGSFGFNTPGTVLYSATVPIVEATGTTVTFMDPSGSVLLPDVVGIGLIFGGIEFDPTGAAADAGPLLYDPPTVGSSLDDYWLRGFPNPGDPWGLYTFGGNPPVNIGARISAVSGTPVPEPTVLALLSVGSIALIARRRTRSA